MENILKNKYLNIGGYFSISVAKSSLGDQNRPKNTLFFQWVNKNRKKNSIFYSIEIGRQNRCNSHLIVLVYLYFEYMSYYSDYRNDWFKGI